MGFCPDCRSEYREAVQACPTCGAALVNELPPLAKRPGVDLPAIKRFFSRFAGRDTTPPWLQSFLLEQTPDWRHTALAAVLVIAMTQLGIGKIAWLREAIAPTGLMMGWRAVPVTASVLIGSAFLGLVGALIARRLEWLWGLIGICGGLAVQMLAMAAMHPDGKPFREQGSTTVLLWGLSPSAPGGALITAALICAAAGGLLARTRLRRWSVGIVTVCIVLAVLAFVHRAVVTVALRVLGQEWSGPLLRSLVEPLWYALYGIWVGWAMRRSGLSWGLALGVFLLYDSLTQAAVLPGRPPGIGWVLAAAQYYAAYVISKAALAAVGGLVGQYLWQRRAGRRSDAALARPDDHSVSC